jgi:hypothetical protein
MSAALDFNSAPPTDGTALWRTVTIGWEHEVIDDTVVLTRGADGSPVARTYRIPTHVTAKQLIDGASGLSEERLAAMQSGGMAGMLELADLVLGGKIVETVASDPTVPTEAFVRFLNAVLSDLDLGDLAGGDLGNS